MGKQTIGYAACDTWDNSQNNWNLIYCQNNINKYNLRIYSYFFSKQLKPSLILLLHRTFKTASFKIVSNLNYLQL